MVSEADTQYVGAPAHTTTTDDSTTSRPAPKAEDLEASKRPEPGLSHRQKDRPVGKQTAGDTAAKPAARQDLTLASSQASPAPQKQPSVQAQPTPQPSQEGRHPRASLQPLSAVPQALQGAGPPQAPVRYADFAGGQQDKKAPANVLFWLTFHAEFGQRLRVVGSHKNLGMLSIPYNLKRHCPLQRMPIRLRLQLACQRSNKLILPVSASKLLLDSAMLQLITPLKSISSNWQHVLQHFARKHVACCTSEA